MHSFVGDMGGPWSYMVWLPVSQYIRSLGWIFLVIVGHEIEMVLFNPPFTLFSYPLQSVFSLRSLKPTPFKISVECSQYKSVIQRAKELKDQ